MLRIAVFVSGGGTNLQAIIDKIEEEELTNIEIGLVVSSNSDAYARVRAKKHNLEYVVVNRNDFEDSETYENALLSILSEKSIELVVLAGFMCILGENFVKEYENRIINIHPSLIPAFSGEGFYGIKVHEAALEKGVKLTGATVHFVDAIADNGPIIIQKAVEVHDDDTPIWLQKRVMEQAEWEILPKAIQLIADGRVAVVNNRVIIE